eukprot:TRINITY_DN2292_c2_g1_i2.p1 TRINITY_DN2292_c2_g1~~TRINITY_DN2292_c2_g1_i2.p1  ORF type:complete len:450 (+),score=107.72 TRINITY_DN2292_c2_g1_i2:70-1419(+)
MSQSDEEPELEDFLRTKVEENLQLVEYISLLEENAAKTPDEVKELKEQVEALSERLEEYQCKEAHWEELSSASAQTESELSDLKKELAEVTLQASKESAEKEEQRRKAEEEAEDLKEKLNMMKTEVAKIRESQSRSLSRSNSSSASVSAEHDCIKREEELTTLRKAVCDLRMEVQTKQNLPPMADFKRIADERDALKQVVQQQHKKLSQLQKKLHGLPPRPPGSPGAVPCLDGQLIIEDSINLGVLEVNRSEAPSRNSGTDTPALPELQSRTASGFASPAFLSSYSVTPELCHSAAPTSSEGRSYHSSRTCSINISEQSSERPAFSVSPTPSEISSKMRSCPTSPAAAVRPTMTYPTSTTARSANSYASQALTRAFNRQQQVLSGRSDSPLRPIRYPKHGDCEIVEGYSSRSCSRRNSSPSTSTSRSRKSPSINPRDRAFAPLVFSIDP